MSNFDIQPTQKSKNLRNNIIVIVLSAILLVMLVLFFMQRRQNQMVIGDIRAEKDSIQQELTQIVAGYDLLKTENDTINEQLFLAQNRVRDLLIEVEQTKRVSYEKITDYQKQVTTLRGIMRDFVVQIDSLNKRNEQLMAENTQVKEQFKKSEMEKQQLSEEKDNLQKNLQRAAQLEARELIAEGLNSRSKETKFAKRTEKIRVSFVLSKNITSKRGAKNIYVRIMRPDQLLMTKSPNDLFQFEDLKIPFSAMREVNYEGQDLPVAIYWDNIGESELMIGTYTIDLFADGNNIGTTTIEFK
jgi:FtsZ-binding cell division protein ZapB/regulator of replication initiation timing